MDDTLDGAATAQGDDDVNTEATAQPDGAQDDPEGADQLGDAGKKALDAMKRERQEAKAETRELRKQLEQLQQQMADKDKTPDEQAIEAARRDAAAEERARAHGQLKRLAIKAEAAGKLHDPADALAHLDLDSIEIDDDGNVDESAVTEAIADLLKSKPYLAAQGGPKAPLPDRSQGARGNGAASTAQQFADAIAPFI
ncbi:hypothetical protein B1813_18970 [Saccharomonospora piscinae]|uniref:Scaffolding protein n=1 Tax=Saccharomonospora piscinae TaxID=687388 RepID=A0A1V8ZYV0_SACPI|nr:hypothetical protein [Saccharomonospora piscinae]OQO89923.1 hypothetical protein B1813_18970 [Saccharomonospora piscinae]